jgi:dihydropteroate synthase
VPVDPHEELARVIPVIEGLVAHGAVVSVDTRHASVARAAIRAGASIINDVTGFTDPDMREVAYSSDAGLVIVRSRKTGAQEYSLEALPQTGQDSLAQRVGSSGFDGIYESIDPTRIVLDPGFGFVDTYEEDLALWAQLDHLIHGQYPVLVGLSRKRLVGRISGIESPGLRDEPSAQLALAAIQHGAHVVRVHDVARTRHTLDSFSHAPAVTAYVALGSNLGERKAYLDAAVARIEALPATRVAARSSCIETSAQYVTDQPDFLNGAVRIETRLPLFALFTELQSIEVALGRVKEYDKGPRVIDLDLLRYGDMVYQTKELTVPHPRMHERDFVLRPLSEIEV